MIILRQKKFTFQDQRVLEEWKNATNNGVDLPKGIDGMTARDVFRLHDNGVKIDHVLRGNKTLAEANINWDDVNTLSKHIGLPELGKGAQHILHKFTDPAIRDRYLRMHSTKKGYERYKEIEKLEKEQNSRIDRLKKAKESLIDQDKYFDGRTKKGESKSDQYGRLYQQANTYYNRKYTELGKDLYRDYGYGGDQLDLDSKQDEILNKVFEEEKNIPASRREKQIIKDNLKQGGHTIKFVNKPSKSNSVRFGIKGVGEIEETARNIHTPSIMHEIGHPEWLKRLTRVSGYKGPEKIDPKIYDDVNKSGGFFDTRTTANLGNENGATSEAISRLRKGGASKEEVEKAKSHLRNAYKTYFYDAEMKLANKLSAPKPFYMKEEERPSSIRERLANSKKLKNRIPKFGRSILDKINSIKSKIK